jgi:hypothetical protein
MLNLCDASPRGVTQDGYATPRGSSRPSPASLHGAASTAGLFVEAAIHFTNDLYTLEIVKATLRSLQPGCMAI